MQITATEAKNRFGSICALAKREPVFVEKAGQIDTVILSVDQYRALQANQSNSSLVNRKKQFENEFGEWIAAQNTWVENQGIPGSDLRPW
jgi:PHD/YefM family antitoxin component YafN of YafNO toxin-antitoxin module